MATIAIVGAGFSGTLLALHLLRRCSTSTHIHLIERNHHFGSGAAYSTGNPNHLLNVRAERMSAFQDRPDHFLKWIETQPATSSGGESSAHFVPRRLYGAYIRHLLLEEIHKPDNRGRLKLSRGDVQAIDETDNGLILCMDGHRRVDAHMAVLAIGNFAPEAPPGVPITALDASYYRADPWAADTFDHLDTDAGVLMIGTGLTMVDSVISLLDRGHRGPIYVVSRRGLLPTEHSATAHHPPSSQPAFPTRLTALTRYVREACDQAERAGDGWRSAIDLLRPFTRDLWQALSAEDRSRFLRHLRPWWDIHRHRLAPPVAERIAAARASGQMQVHAGRIQSLAERDRRVRVEIRQRRTGTMNVMEVSRIINCSGPGCDYDRISDPLVRSLLARGQVRPDRLRLGLDVTGNCAVKRADGAISRRLFAVGPVTKGAFWEIVAVPDIRLQCEALGDFLAGHVGYLQAGSRPATNRAAPVHRQPLVRPSAIRKPIVGHSLQWGAHQDWGAHMYHI
jgi:uncharacterized NAD(P)/FAD-binding protein YdhS